MRPQPRWRLSRLCALARHSLHVQDQPHSRSSRPRSTPNDARYWDARDLEGEMRRMFEICHNCRMCVGYCGTFPDVFARVDRDIEKHGAAGAELLDGRRLRERDRSLLAVQALLRQVPVHARRGTRVDGRRPPAPHAREGAARAAQRRHPPGPRARRAAASGQDDGRAHGAGRQLRERQSPRAKDDAGHGGHRGRVPPPPLRGDRRSRRGSRGTSRSQAPARGAPSRSSRRASPTTTSPASPPLRSACSRRTAGPSCGRSRPAAGCPTSTAATSTPRGPRRAPT